MAGSVPVLTVYVCDECKLPGDAVIAASSGVGICHDLNHVIDNLAVPVEYVPREQADALAERIEKAAKREEWGDDFEAEVLAAVKAYLEATSE